MLDILLSYVEPVVDGKPMLTVLSVALTGFVCVALYSAARKLTAALALILLVVTGAATLLIRDSLLATDLLVGSLALCLGMLAGQSFRSKAHRRPGAYPVGSHRCGNPSDTRQLTRN